ncbi:MAG: hypothetical protein AAF525_21405 [Pseudomonadota bacterium]
MIRQQILYLWLGGGALDTGVVAWAFHDGAKGEGPTLPEDEPPYRSGVAALRDGWFLLQSPRSVAPKPGEEHYTNYLNHEFIFERRVEVPDQENTQ